MSSRPEAAAQAARDTIAIDTGVWLEGLLFGGSAEELVKVAITGRVRLITSQRLIAELSRVLEKHFAFSKTAIREVCIFVRSCAEIIPELNDPKAGDAAHAVLEVARRGHATAIATTDRGSLLRLGSFQGIPIVRVS